MVTSDAIQILGTDALSGLRSLPSETVQVSLTSPPFYLLRRYGTSISWPDGWEGELGHEPHPNDFVRHLLYVFDEVWRVLRDDGCLWVNLADTFNNKQGKKGTTNAPDGSDGRFAAGGRGYAESLRHQPGFFKHYVPSITTTSCACTRHDFDVCTGTTRRCNTSITTTTRGFTVACSAREERGRLSRADHTVRSKQP